MMTVLLIVIGVVLYHAMGLGVLAALLHIPGDLRPERYVRPLVIVLWPLVLVLLGGALVVGWGQGMVECVREWRGRRRVEDLPCPPERTLHFVDGPDGGAFFDGLGRRVMDPNVWLAREGSIATPATGFVIHDVGRVQCRGPLANPMNDRGGGA